jgi:hypothetical protein
VSGLSFDDLPIIRNEDEMRRVHNEAGMYYLSKGLVAHAEMTCHLAFGDDNPRKVVDNPRWRMAKDTECRRLGARWCVNCCE